MQVVHSVESKIRFLYLVAGLVVYLLLVSASVSAVQNTTDNTGSTRISKQTYETMGRAYAEAISKKDVNKLARLFDMEQFAYTAASTVFDSRKDINGYVQGLLKRKEETFLSQIYVAVFRQDVSAKYLRLLEGKQPLIRIDYSEGGHEYVILYIGQTKGGEPQVIDMFFLTSGKKLSVALGAASQLVLRPSKSILKRIFGKVEINTEVLDSVRKIGLLKKEGKFKEAYQQIDTLPDSIKNSRIMIDTAIQLSQFIGDPEYRKQLNRLDKYFGKDETTDFILIDHHFFNKNFDKALLSIDRLIRRFGVDEALLTLKASTYYAAKNYTRAEDYANRAIRHEPAYEDAYWTLATILAEAEKFAGLIDVLNRLEKKFGYAFKADNFFGSDIYSKFVKSAEFKARFK